MLENRINQVTVRNYRSLGDVTVDLNDLTVLVGMNGSGKSNFLDVLQFVKEALVYGLATTLAFSEGASIYHVHSFSESGEAADIHISIAMLLDGEDCEYSFTLRSLNQGNTIVSREFCRIGKMEYEISDGELRHSTLEITTPIQERNLILPLLSSLKPFENVYKFLVGISFYSIFPDNLRLPQSPNRPYPLEESGDNLASVLRDFIRKGNPWLGDFYNSFARIVPDVSPDNPIIIDEVGSYLVMLIKHNKGDRVFNLELESDGTLRVLGLLTALYQHPPLPFIGIEEPEIMIHPKAVRVLGDIIVEASQRTQIILTTHSPDLISRFSADTLRLVELHDGNTHIDPVREEMRQAINDQLFSGGDLLRIGGLERG